HRACHPERSEAESKDPVMLPSGDSAGFLDFARNDRALGHRSLTLWISFFLPRSESPEPTPNTRRISDTIPSAISSGVSAPRSSPAGAKNPALIVTPK